MNIRNKKPEKGNKFYNTTFNGGYSWCIKGKPTDKDCNVLANCVGYSCGRFNEIIGAMKYPQLNCNAENFIERARELKLEIADKPSLGGIMVWQKGATLSNKDGAGHVEVVERIDSHNQIYTSSSDWNGRAFYNNTRKNDNSRWGMSKSYKFRGCIINPKIGYKPAVEKTVEELAQEVLKGIWGNGLTRRIRLTQAGYSYSAVQKRVNELVKQAKKENIYIVKKGDTLIKIAKKYKTNWQKIYEDNKKVIGKNPNLIKIGQKLVIK